MSILVFQVKPVQSCRRHKERMSRGLRTDLITAYKFFPRRGAPPSWGRACLIWSLRPSSFFYVELHSTLLRRPFTQIPRCLRLEPRTVATFFALAVKHSARSYPRLCHSCFIRSRIKTK
jgi:hypothetical protein